MSKLWEWYARLYDTLNWLIPYQELLDKTVQALSPRNIPLKILDAGCGTGNLVKLLAERAAPGTIIHGLDASLAMLGRAVRKTGGLSGVSYSRYDLNKSPLPYADASFDRVANLNVLYALENPKQVLAEFWRILKLGELLVIANPRREPPLFKITQEHFRLALERGLFGKPAFWKESAIFLPQLVAILAINGLCIKRRARQGKYHFFNHDELSALLEKAGFRIVFLERAYAGTGIFAVASKKLAVRHRGQGLFTVSVAHSAEDLREIHRLRFEIYCEEMGSLDPLQYPEREERNHFDADAIHFMLHKESEFIGAIRVIRDTPRGFLMEEAFPLPRHLDRAKIVEASRLMLRQEHRGKDLSSFLDEAARQWCLEHGFTMWCLAMQEKLLPHRERRGWKVVKLGPGFRYHDTTVVPILRLLE